MFRLYGQHLPLADRGAGLLRAVGGGRAADRVRVTSAETGPWHVGEGADRQGAAGVGGEMVEPNFRMWV